MTVDLQQLETRVQSLELTAKRWRVVATTLCMFVVALGVTAFYPTQSVPTIDAQRITLHSEGVTVGTIRIPPSRVEMSLDRGGSLRLQYFADSIAERPPLPQRPELRLLDATGHEVARLGAVAFRLLK